MLIVVVVRVVVVMSAYSQPRNRQQVHSSIEKDMRHGDSGGGCSYGGGGGSGDCEDGVVSGDNSGGYVSPQLHQR